MTNSRRFGARLRGFEMPEDARRFLLKRLDREMRSLFMTLDQPIALPLPPSASDHSFRKERSSSFNGPRPEDQQQI